VRRNQPISPLEAAATGKRPEIRVVMALSSSIPYFKQRPKLLKAKKLLETEGAF
jgi:hypothetical protein